MEYVIVPSEPTSKMVECGYKVHRELSYALVRDVYRAMLAAATVDVPHPDTTRLDFLAKSLHIDGTGDEPIYSMFVPGVNPWAEGDWNARQIIDAGMCAALAERSA